MVHIGVGLILLTEGCRQYTTVFLLNILIGQQILIVQTPNTTVQMVNTNNRSITTQFEQSPNTPAKATSYYKMTSS